MTSGQTLLVALSDEFALMKQTVDGLSALVLDHASRAAPEDRTRVLVQAQAVDDLSQRLQALHELGRTLSRGASVESALAAVPLAALAGRLRNGGPEALAMASVHSDAGDLVLFD